MPQLLYNGRFDHLNIPITANDMLDYFIDCDKPSSMILIVPTQRFANYLKRIYIRNYFKKTGKPCSKINIFTLQRFAEYCYYKLFAHDSARIISEPYYITLIEEAIEQCKLEFFRSKSKNISLPLITKIGAIIYGIKEDGITPEVLYNDLENYNPNSQINKALGGVKEPKRLKDIADIFDKYQQLLGNQLLDKPQVFIELAKRIGTLLKEDLSTSRAVESLFESRLPSDNFPLDKFFHDDSIVLFYGFSEFKMPEVKFIQNFSYSKLPVAIHLDYTEINGPLFDNLRETAKHLRTGGFSEATVLDDVLQFHHKPEYDINLEPSRYLRRWLFNAEREIRNPNLAKSIQIIAAENALDEVRSIAKIVHYLVKDKNIPISEICICMRSPESYTSLFREVFGLNNIPAIITDRFKLSNSQLITTIILALEVVINDFTRNDLTKLIQSSYIEFAFEDQPIDSGNIKSVAKKLRIFGGRKRCGKIAWQTSIDSRIKYLENQLIKIQESADSIELLSIQQQIDTLKKALSDLEKVFNLLDFENTNYTPNEINLLIKKRIIERLKIKESILHFFQDINNKKGKLGELEYYRLIEEVEKDASALAKFIKLLDELTSIANERASGKKQLLENFIHKLKLAVASEKYQIKEKPGWGATITAIEQTRGIPYRAIILCGAIDGAFPLKYRTENMLGKILPASESRHLESEKIQFYQFLSNNPELLDSSEQKLYITYPTHREEQELVPSPFINALCKISTLGEQFDLENPNSATYIYLSQIRNNMANSISQHDNLKWINYITEKSEIFRYFALGYFDDKSICDYLPNSDLQYLVNFIKLRKNQNTIENINIDELSDNAKNYLQNFTNKAFSISELEEYAQCPFKYFTNKVLNISQPEDDSKEITPFERGNLLHIIVYKFYTFLRSIDEKSGVVLIKLNSENRSFYLEKLLEIAESELERLQYAHPFFDLEKQAIIGTQQRKGLLEYWLDTEIQRHCSENNEFYPALFEYAFGMGTKQNSSKKNYPLEIADGLKVSGKIDRIEFNPSMSHFLIADYKTRLSHLPTYKDIQNGIKFQIPIYLAASKKILLDDFNLTDISPAGGVYYSFIPSYFEGDNKFKNHKYLMLINEYLTPLKDKYNKGPVIFPEELDEQITSSIDYIKDILSNISNGKFAKKIDLQKCNCCLFHPFCRRLDTKSNADLSHTNDNNIIEESNESN